MGSMNWKIRPRGGDRIRADRAMQVPCRLILIAAIESDRQMRRLPSEHEIGLEKGDTMSTPAPKGSSY